VERDEMKLLEAFRHLPRDRPRGGCGCCGGGCGSPGTNTAAGPKVKLFISYLQQKLLLLHLHSLYYSNRNLLVIESGVNHQEVFFFHIRKNDSDSPIKIW